MTDEIETPSCRTLVREAYAFLEQGKCTLSYLAALEASLADPDDPDAWCILGRAHRAMGEVDEAERCFDRCVDIRFRAMIRETYGQIV